ncbi:retinol-binding protein 1.1 isoform X1 [Girardinichthys multiradiatus]|uniref:retinol-binding protein 1.1 isoform X1 n=1 Tax=Girardinichthys multiradiatus TaxID=208333 RepID=UPI001FABC81E|nr:retinol-binding protein 1.1 isoform X1 [Girardinichthys multiradiatus]
MPVDMNGYWKMISNENFEEYMKALDVNVAIRKIALLLKPDKDIVHDGDHLIIKTLSTFKNYNMDFYVGKEFEEDLLGVDDRKCMTFLAVFFVTGHNEDQWQALQEKSWNRQNHHQLGGRQTGVCSKGRD